MIHPCIFRVDEAPSAEAIPRVADAGIEEVFTLTRSGTYSRNGGLESVSRTEAEDEEGAAGRTSFSAGRFDAPSVGQRLFRRPHRSDEKAVDQGERFFQASHIKDAEAAERTFRSSARRTWQWKHI